MKSNKIIYSKENKLISFDIRNITQFSFTYCKKWKYPLSFRPNRDIIAIFLLGSYCRIFSLVNNYFLAKVKHKAEFSALPVQSMELSFCNLIVNILHRSQYLEDSLKWPSFASKPLIYFLDQEVSQLGAILAKRLLLSAKAFPASVMSFHPLFYKYLDNCVQINLYQKGRRANDSLANKYYNMLIERIQYLSDHSNEVPYLEDWWLSSKPNLLYHVYQSSLPIEYLLHHLAVHHQLLEKLFLQPTLFQNLSKENMVNLSEILFWLQNDFVFTEETYLAEFALRCSAHSLQALHLLIDWLDLICQFAYHITISFEIVYPPNSKENKRTIQFLQQVLYYRDEVRGDIFHNPFTIFKYLWLFNNILEKLMNFLSPGFRGRNNLDFNKEPAAELPVNFSFLYRPAIARYQYGKSQTRFSALQESRGCISRLFELRDYFLDHNGYPYDFQQREILEMHFPSTYTPVWQISPKIYRSLLNLAQSRKRAVLSRVLHSSDLNVDVSDDHDDKKSHEILSRRELWSSVNSLNDENSCTEFQNLNLRMLLSRSGAAVSVDSRTSLSDSVLNELISSNSSFSSIPNIEICLPLLIQEEFSIDDAPSHNMIQTNVLPYNSGEVDDYFSGL